MLKIKHIIILSIIIASFVSTSCSNKKDSKKNITVSILPQKYLVERICGNKYTVNVLIPPGESPETCEMTPSQIRNLLSSKLYFSIGYLAYEQSHIKNVLEENSCIKHINLSANIKLVKDIVEHEEHHHEGGIDPHIWTSPANVKIMCKDIYDALVTSFPENTEFFTENYNKLTNDIISIDTLIANKLEAKTNRNFIIYHPALTYFAKDYGLNQISIEFDGKSPSAKYIQDIIVEAKKSNTKVVFVQKQFDTAKAEFIAKEINGKVIPIDPLNENWLKEMNSILEALDKYLE